MIANLAPGPRGPDQWWLENLDLTKRNQPWLVVDPADGKIPALTAGRGASAVRACGAASSAVRSTVPEDFNLLERCISRGVPGR